VQLALVGDDRHLMTLGDHLVDDRLQPPEGGHRV
jgi:hypothetical protein